MKQIIDTLACEHVAQCVINMLNSKSNTHLSFECQSSLLHMIAGCCRTNKQCRNLFLNLGILDVVVPQCTATNHPELLCSVAYLFEMMLCNEQLPSFKHMQPLLEALSLLLMFDVLELLEPVLGCYCRLLKLSLRDDASMIDCSFVLRGGMQPAAIISDFRLLWQSQDKLCCGAIRHFVDDALIVPRDIVSEIGCFFHAFPKHKVETMDCDVPRRLISIARDPSLNACDCAEDFDCDCITLKERVLGVAAAASLHGDFESDEWIEHGIVEQLQDALRSESKSMNMYVCMVLGRLSKDRAELLSNLTDYEQQLMFARGDLHGLLTTLLSNLNGL